MKRQVMAITGAGLLAAALIALASACGGGGGKKSATSANTSVTGSISVEAVWSGAEQSAFKRVLAGFMKQYPNVRVSYKSDGDQLPTVLATEVAGGNPPDLAVVPQPGLMKQFVQKGALKSIDFAKSTIQQHYAPVWIDLGTVNGKLYGIVFKGANKSTVWYNVPLFKAAGVSPPKSWTQLLSVGNTLKASGTMAYSIGGADGWTLTDLFENIFLRQAGPTAYDQLTTHDMKWTAPPVKKALTTMAQVLSQSSNIAGGTQGALLTDFPTSVTNVFSSSPKAAMVFEGDFVEGVITSSTKAKPITGFNEFPFPAVDGKGLDYVMGGGDTVVMFKNSAAARALVNYLVTPQAAEIWAKIGGFSSPNKDVPASVYKDPIGRRVAVALATAPVFRFDMSDQAPASFGATVGSGEWKILQDFLKNPSDVNGIASQLEAAATKAYGH
jgi:alpha-glucoside transport system substrate-binding protein